MYVLLSCGLFYRAGEFVLSGRQHQDVTTSCDIATLYDPSNEVTLPEL